MSGKTRCGSGRRLAVLRRGAGAQAHARQRGFSLLEILAVAALIAVAGLLAAAILGGGAERMRMRAAVNDVAANLRFTRAHALATGTPQRFTIDPAARTWQAPRGRSGRISDRVEVAFTGAREMQAHAGEGAIVFFGDGASTGGRVRLVAGDARRDVDVAWLTGEVRVHRNPE